MGTLRLSVFCCLLAAAGAAAQDLPLRHDLTENPSSGAEAVAFSPDGKLLATIRDRGKLRLWDTATGKPVADVERHGGVNAYVAEDGMAFSPDVKMLAVGVASGISTTGHVILWDVKDGKALERRITLEGHTKGVRSVAFTPDGATLLSAGLDNEIRLWDVSTGKTRSVLRGHRERILGMVLSADGKVLVSGDPDEVKVWDLRTQKETATWKVKELVGLAITPDGKTAAVSSFPDGGITFWDVASGKQRADLKPIPEGTSPMAFSPDGKRFVSVNRDRRAVSTVMLTDLASGRALVSYAHRGNHVNVARFSPDGTLLVSGDSNENGFAQLHVRDISNLLPRKGRE